MRWTMMYTSSVLALLLGAHALNANDSATTVPTRLDPSLRLAQSSSLGNPRAAVSRSLSLQTVDDRTHVDVFVKGASLDQVRAALAKQNGVIHSEMGAIVTATIPLANAEALTQEPGIIYVEAAKALRPRLNQSMSAIRVTNVNTTSGASAASLPQAYTGSGVIVAAVDSGIDCTHADYKDSSGTTRIIAYWDQATTGSGVTELSDSGGREYTGSALESGGACENSRDTEGHGSHVTGIMTSNNATYRGAAPEANIIMVEHNATDASSDGTFATTVVDGVNYIFRKAQSLHKPVVVNLSLGSSLGAHDGTSLFESSLDALLTASGSDKQGRAIVNAAGNENFPSYDSQSSSFGGIHAAISVSNTTKAFDFLLRDVSSGGSTDTVFDSFGGAQVDIWLASGSDCTVQVDAYPQSSKSSVTVDMSAVSPSRSASAADSKVNLALDFSDSSNANNGKQHALVTITKVSSSVSSTSITRNYSFDLIFSGTCTGDAWLYPDYTAYNSFRKTSALPVTTNPVGGYTYVSGDSDKTTTIPATANKVIAVGAFKDVATWTSLAGTQDQTTLTGGSAGGISLFSSLGPSGDNRTKPEVSAPGEPIVSTLSSAISASSVGNDGLGDSTHMMLYGTSMASPHVAGVIALMLQRNPCLTITQIRSALTSSATADSFTGTVPNNTWGYGKVDALGAVRAVDVASCTPDNPSENGVGASATSSGTTTSADTSGGGSCSLMM